MVGDPSRSTVVSEVGGLGLRLTGPEGGQLLVALPGLGRGAADFDPLARRLADAGWRTAALDPRGVGTSRGPASAASLDDHAGDVARVVEALGAAPAWIVGHTFGSRVARLLAHRQPRLVKRLLLLAVGGTVPPDAETVALARRFMAGLVDGSYAAGGAAHEEGLELAAQIYFSPRSRVPEGWLEGFSPAGLAAQRQASHGTPPGPWLAGGEAPMTVIQGLDDRIAPPENGRTLARKLGPRVTLHEVADAGHFLLLERPGEIASLFLRDRHLATRRR